MINKNAAITKEQGGEKKKVLGKKKISTQISTTTITTTTIPFYLITSLFVWFGLVWFGSSVLLFFSLDVIHLYDGFSIRLLVSIGYDVK
jgi:uncharacterized membrane protein